MYSKTPLSLEEILAQLREESCLTYRLRVDDLRTAEEKKPGTLFNMGTSLVDVLQMGANHAAKAVAAGKDFPVSEYLKNRWLCEITRLKDQCGNVVKLHSDSKAA